MALDEINNQNNPSQQIASSTSQTSKINQDRKTFACTVTLLVVATLMILSGIVLLFTIGSLGLSVPLSGILGTFAVTVGAVLFITGLTILVRKSLGIEQKNEDLNFLKIKTPTPPARPLMSKFSVTCSTISIVLGMALLIGAVVSVFFLTGYLQLGLCAGLVGLGTALFVAGLARMSPRSLADQEGSGSADSQSNIVGIGEPKTAQEQKWYKMAVVRGEDGIPTAIRLTPEK